LYLLLPVGTNTILMFSKQVLRSTDMLTFDIYHVRPI